MTGQGMQYICNEDIWKDPATDVIVTVTPTTMMRTNLFGYTNWTVWF